MAQGLRLAGLADNLYSVVRWFITTSNSVSRDLTPSSCDITLLPGSLYVSITGVHDPTWFMV